MLLIGVATSASAQGQRDGTGATADAYWQIELAPGFAAKDRGVEFYRTHTVGGTTEVSLACDESGKTLAKAAAKQDGSWALGPEFGNLSAKIGDAGQLLLTLDGAEYATGTRVGPIACKNGLPESIAFTEVVPKRPSAQNAAPESTLDLHGDFAHLAAALNVALPIQRVPPPPEPAPQADTSNPLSNGDDYVCKFTPMRPAQVRMLQNVPLLSSSGQIWAGALLQGKYYAQGNFAPITIPRAGGSVTVTGVNFGSGARFESSFDADVMSKDNVQDGINALLAHRASTEAEIEFSADVVYNDDQMAYSLGVDGRFLNGLNNTIHLDTDSPKSFVLAKFRQTYYRTSFAPPETRTSVFRDGNSFEDPDNQIGADNPPLYIGDVGYGRVIYFLVSSPYGGDAVKQALSSAYDASSTCQPVGCSKILQDSTVSYFVQGGDELPALGHMGKISGVADMYGALKQTIADARLAQVTEFSKGVPVTYTVNYLANRADGAMGFASSYNVRQCSTVTPKRYASFFLTLTCIDDTAKVTLNDPAGRETQVYTGGGRTPQYFVIDDFIQPAQIDDTFVLRLEDYNAGASSCLDFHLLRSDYPHGLRRNLALDSTGKTMVNPDVGNRDQPQLAPIVSTTGGTGLVGWISDYRIRINRGTGEVTVIQGN